MKLFFLAALCVCGLLAGQAQAVVAWDETVDGDISGDRLAPDSVVLALGSNTVAATSVSGDREYITLTVPAGLVLSQVVLNAYAGQDGTAFIAVQSGTTFTEPPTGTNPANLLGYTHFGPAVQNIGDDILPTIGTEFGAIGFTPPLPAGEYTWWMQQTGTNATTYEFDFVVIPEPATLGLMLLGGAVMLRRR